jgi:hypothetical protein
MRLTELHALPLGLDDLDRWPDSRMTPDAVIERLSRDLADRVVPSRRFTAAFHLDRLDRRRAGWLLELEGRLRVGQAPDGYGLDALSVGGHAAIDNLAQRSEQRGSLEDHLLPPDGMKPDAWCAGLEPDFSIVLTRDGAGRLRPLLPGSGLRGALRHALSRRLNAAAKRGGVARRPIQDPNEGVRGKGAPEDPVEALFGYMTRGARLLVADAGLEGDDWQAALLQHHAEDEFSGGVFASSKFDRIVLIEGAFRWRIVVETDDRVAAEKARKALEPLLIQGMQGHLPVGGGRWRGVGWPTWTVERCSVSRLGDDAVGVGTPPAGG